MGETHVTDAAEIPTAHAILPDAPDTFCTYLARQLVAKEGYSIGVVAEAAPLAENSDIALMHHDGYSLTLVCLIDREAHPGKTFELTPEAVSDIGKACLQYTGRIHRAK